MQGACTLIAARHAWLAGLQGSGQLAPAEVRRLREENAVLRQQLSKVDPQAGHVAVAAEVDKLTAAMRETSRELRLVRGLPRGRHCGACRPGGQLWADDEHNSQCFSVWRQTALAWKQ